MALIAMIVIATASAVIGLGGLHQYDPVVKIMDESSFGICADFPYEICVTSSAIGVVQMGTGTNHSNFSLDEIEEAYLTVLTPEEARRTKSLFGENLEATWRNVKDIERSNLNIFEQVVRDSVEGILVAKAFEDNPTIDFRWLVQNTDTLEQASIQCGVELNNTKLSGPSACIGIRVTARLWPDDMPSIEELLSRVSSEREKAEKNLEILQKVSDQLYNNADRAQGEGRE